MDFKGLLTALTAVFLLLSCTEEPLSEGYALQEGDLCPTFTAVDITGKEHRFPVMGKPSVIILFDMGCGDCRKQLPVIHELYETYQEQVAFLGIGRGHSQEEVADLWKGNGFSLPVTGDKDRSLYNLFAEQTVPRIYIMDGDRIVLATDDRNMLDMTAGQQVLEHLLND